MATCEQFIDQALSSQTRFRLSYSDPQQKWLIRTHILALLRDFPGFAPSFGTFTHPDGTAAHLLCAAGSLRVRPWCVTVTIWVHQNHPFMAPIVELSPPPGPAAFVRDDHPFVEAQSGLATCPYLETWSHPGRSSLPALLRNLARLFSLDHPFVLPVSPPSHKLASADKCLASSLLMSKLEALDRLAGSAHYDLAILHTAADDEISTIVGLRDKITVRKRHLTKAVSKLEHERTSLRTALAGLAERSDALINFLRINDLKRIEAEIGGHEGVDEAFETEDPKDNLVLELLAAERGVEDAMYAMEKAFEGGIVGVDVYVKHVRLLAREQFGYRFKLVHKLGASRLLRWAYYC